MKTSDRLREQCGEVSKFLTSEIGEKFDEVEASLGQLASSLKERSVADLIALRDEVKGMIEFVTKRSEAADAERFKYLQSSLQVIGFALVFSSFALAGLDKTTIWS